MKFNKAMVFLGILAGIFFSVILISKSKKRNKEIMGNIQLNEQVKKYIIIHVLDKKYYDDAHIPGTINVSSDHLEKFLSELPNKEQNLVFYCANIHCPASDHVAMKAFEKGFKNVFVYAGGINDWYTKNQLNKEKYPIDGPCDEGFLKEYFSPEKIEEYLEEKISSLKGTTIQLLDAEELLNILQNN